MTRIEGERKGAQDEKHMKGYSGPRSWEPINNIHPKSPDHDVLDDHVLRLEVSS